MPGVEPVEVPPDPTVFAGSWFNSAAIIKCELNFFFSPLEGGLRAPLGPATCLSVPDPSQVVPNVNQSPSAAPGGCRRGSPSRRPSLGR